MSNLNTSPLQTTQNFIRFHLEKGDLEAALACLADEILWFGTGAVEVAHNKAEARKLLAAELANRASRYGVEFSELQQKCPLDNCGTVFGLAVIQDTVSGSLITCRIVATCVKQGEQFLISVLQLSLEKQLPPGQLPYPLSLLGENLEEIKPGFLEASRLAGWVCCEISEHFAIHYINQYYVNMLGFASKEELWQASGGNYAALISSKDNVKDIFRIAEALPVGGDVNFTYRMVTKSGEEIWVRDHSYKYLDQEGQARLLCLCLNISDLIRLENDIKQREAEYRLAIANSGKLVYKYIVKERAVEISGEVAELFELPSARIENVPDSLIKAQTVAPESIAVFRDFYEAIGRGEPTGSMTVRRKIKGGIYRWFNARFSTIFNERGEPVSAVILFKDITNRREEHIDNALDRERLLGALKNLYPISISNNFSQNSYRMLSGFDYLIHPHYAEGKIDDFVQASAKLMPWKFSQEFIDKFNASAMLAKFTAGSNLERLEYQLLGKEQILHWMEIMVLPIQNSYNDDVLGITLCRFIDEQKEAEEKLKQALEITNEELSQERQYQRIIDSSLPVCTIILRPADNKLLHIGGTLLSELGYSEADLVEFQNNRLQGLIWERDYQDKFHNFCLSQEDQQLHFEQEFRIVGKDGSLVWLYEKGKLVELDNGDLVYILVDIDITHRKEMEEKLRINEEEMSLAMTQMGKMICLYDVQSKTLTMPEAYAAKHGLPTVVADLIASLDQRGILETETRPDFINFYNSISQGIKTGVAEAYLKCADGSKCWERAEFVSIFDRDGQPLKAIIAVEDTTLQHEKEKILRENERIFRMVAAHSNRTIFRYDIVQKTAYSSETQGEEGFSVISDLPESIIAQGIILPESREDCRQIFREIQEGKPEGHIKLHILDHNKKPRWMDMRYSIIEDDEDCPKYAVLSCADITEDHEKELAYRRYQQTIRHYSLTEGLIYFETDLTTSLVEKQGGNIPYVNFPASGCTHLQAVNYGIDNLVLDKARSKVRELFSRDHLIAQFTNGVRNVQDEFPVIIPQKGQSWLQADIQMIKDPYSQHIKAYTILRDITEETLKAQRVKKQAEIDGMTGIYNKTTTEDLIKQKLAKPEGRVCALLIADLDNLKALNDNLGHRQGDRALRLIAKVLKEQFQQFTDIIGRIGGDEFMVYFEGVNNKTKLRSMMIALMRKLTALRVGEKDQVVLYGSIGIVLGKTGESSFDDLYSKADKALYYVKRNGKNNYAFYTPDMEKAAYHYQGHNESLLWEVDRFDRAELDRLLYAVSAIYPLVISVNLTKNNYYMLQYDNFTTSACFNAGSFDKLVLDGGGTFHPEDRESFLKTFSRSNLLTAYVRGEKIVRHQGRQLGDDGVYRWICTDVIFVHNETDDDIMEITLAREIEREK